jgi:hypothetical protein
MKFKHFRRAELSYLYRVCLICSYSACFVSFQHSIFVYHENWSGTLEKSSQIHRKTVWKSRSKQIWFISWKNDENFPLRLLKNSQSSISYPSDVNIHLSLTKSRWWIVWVFTFSWKQYEEVYEIILEDFNWMQTWVKFQLVFKL